MFCLKPYRIVPSKRPPPNLTVFVGFFRVFRVTAHHSRVVNSKVARLGSNSCNCSDALWVTRHQASKDLGSHTPVRGLVCSVLPLQLEIRVLQATTERSGNLATRLRVGPFCRTIQFSPLSGWPRRITGKRRCKSIQSRGRLLRIWSGPSLGDPFNKRVLRVTAHPQIWALELRAPMGACSGQYGNTLQMKYLIYKNMIESITISLRD